MAWWRYKALSEEKGLGLGSTAWETGLARLVERIGKGRTDDGG